MISRKIQRENINFKLDNLDLFNCSYFWSHTWLWNLNCWLTHFFAYIFNLLIILCLKTCKVQIDCLKKLCEKNTHKQTFVTRKPLTSQKNQNNNFFFTMTFFLKKKIYRKQYGTMRPCFIEFQKEYSMKMKFIALN